MLFSEFSLDLLRIVFETTLGVSIFGLALVGGKFMFLVGVQVFAFASGSLRRPGPVVPALDETDLPHVLVQIPAFNESEMAAAALRCAAALDWPRDRLHIQLLDDSTDGSKAIAAVAAADLRAQGYDVQHLCRPHRAGYKAGALAFGLKRNAAPIIAILDVDFRPAASWLRSIVPVLLADPKAGFLQSRCEFSNYEVNWLTRAQGLLLDAHFMMEQAGRARAGWLFQFNGTAGVWRREAIDAAGGWSGDSLCEDLDLTVRAELAGWHGIFLTEPAVPGLVPERIQHWRVQQRRWSTGFVQVARKLLARVWASDWSLGKKASATSLICIQAFYPLAAIATLSLVMCLLLRGGDPSLYAPLLTIAGAVIVVVAFTLTLVPYTALKRGPFWRYLLTVTSVLPLMIYVSLSNAPSIVQTFFGRRESFKRTPKVMRPMPNQGLPAASELEAERV